MAGFEKFSYRLWVFSKVLLASNQHNWGFWQKMKYFTDPLRYWPLSVRLSFKRDIKPKVQCDLASAYLLLYVVKAIRVINGKTNQYHVRIWIAQWSKAVIFTLTCCVPKCQFDLFSTNLNMTYIILEHRGDINLVRDCQPRLWVECFSYTYLREGAFGSSAARSEWLVLFSPCPTMKFWLTSEGMSFQKLHRQRGQTSVEVRCLDC